MDEDLKREFAGLRGDIAGVKTDIVGIKTDLADVKADLAGVKTDVVGIKSDLGQLTTLALNTAKGLSSLTGEVAEIKRDMSTKEDYSMLMKRMDGFVDMLQDSRWDWGKQKVRLDDHEKRIGALEAKRA